MKRMVSAARLVAVSFCVCFLATYSTLAQEQAESFDKPVREKVVDVGPSPYLLGGHGKLSCFYFNSFMVKQLDMGEKGAEWISITPNDPVHTTRCTQGRAQRETVIQNWQDGYFGGVKEDFVFLVSADCFDSGCRFGVFETSTRKKLFEDHRRLSPKGKIAQIRFAKNGDSLVMRYPRVVSAECSLPEKKSECWKEILRSTGLPPQPAPKCAEYKGFNQAAGSGTDDLRDPSVVSFPVEVTIPGFKTRILPGPVACWAAD
jgi:hypothetical protein